jgi:hypothetical protein
MLHDPSNIYLVISAVMLLLYVLLFGYLSHWL